MTLRSPVGRRRRGSMIKEPVMDEEFAFCFQKRKDERLDELFLDRETKLVA